mgnify:CR=1 FL=1
MWPAAVQLITWLCEPRYAVFYACVVVRMPDFLGHLTLEVFALIGTWLGGPEYAVALHMWRVSEVHNPSHKCVPLPYHEMKTEKETGEHVPYFIGFLKLALSVGYMVIMHLYFMLLCNVTSRMSEPTSFPRFIFIGQVYYYLFWYRIMATDGPADTQFWGMLILMVFPRMVAAHAGA